MWNQFYSSFNFTENSRWFCFLDVLFFKEVPFCVVTKKIWIIILSSITTSTTMRHLYKPLLSSDSHAAATCSITLNNYFSTLLVSVDLQICLWCLIYLLLLSSDLHISNKLSFAFLTLVLVLVEQVLKKYHYISPTLLL